MIFLLLLILSLSSVTVKANVCSELVSLLGLALPTGSFEQGLNCFGLFWRTSRGTSEICARIEEVASDCPPDHPVTVREAFAYLVSNWPTDHTLATSAAGGATGSVAAGVASSLEEPLFDVLAFGDWGNPRHPEYLEPVASLISDWYRSTGAVFLLGDNFYPKGINASLGVYDPAFRLFSRILAPSTTDANYYVIFGNHDYLGSPDAQIEYSNVHPKWKFPSPYYFKSFRTSMGRICAWFLDTDRDNFDTIQARWLNQTLRNEQNNCMYKIVSGHHPVFDGGEYRSNEHLIRTLLPILSQYNVHLYLSGHEHQSQVLRTPELPTTFLVAGAISDMRVPKSRGHEYLQFINMKNEAILRLEFFADRIDFSFIPSDLVKRRKKQPPKPLAFGSVHRNNLVVS